MDTVIVDFSPLRVVDDAPIVSLAKQVARVTVGVGEDQTEEVNLSQQGLREGFHVEALQTSAIWGVRERERRGRKRWTRRAAAPVGERAAPSR